MYLMERFFKNSSRLISIHPENVRKTFGNKPLTIFCKNVFLTISGFLEISLLLFLQKSSMEDVL